MFSSTALVITSISHPNAQLTRFAEESARHGCRFILIGDSKSPADFELLSCDYWSLERQRSMEFELACTIPEGHYSRKNLGYLQAMSEGAEIIIESDDDNFARDAFWSPRTPVVSAVPLSSAGWVNVYGYFSDDRIWPRGFPLEHLHKPCAELKECEQDILCPIQQGLADENPDVDAVYRLTSPLPRSFLKKASIALGAGSWCSFNSQNTTWFQKVFPLLYLPSFCNFRMTDIWRSFVAQRICWANGWHVHFHAPTVWQERNEHDLLQDFNDEIPGYLNNVAICRELEQLDLVPGEAFLAVNMLNCYEKLVEMGLVGTAEIKLLKAWNADIARLFAHGECRGELG
jgi:hypothetical protein